MNILAIDSITPVLSVTAQGPAGTVTVNLAGGGQHAEKMVDCIERSVELAGFTPRETGLVVCAEGPGSFTGLRLAFSAAKAIQLAAGCPLRPVPPLHCYARAFSEWPGVVLSVLDAKKNRFYVQIFRRGEPVTEALDIDERGVLAWIDSEERVLVTGPDALLFSAALERTAPTLDITALPSGIAGISAEMLAFAQNSDANYTSDIADHDGPLYVRQSDAETSTTEKRT